MKKRERKKQQQQWYRKERETAEKKETDYRRKAGDLSSHQVQWMDVRVGVSLFFRVKDLPEVGDVAGR